MKSLLTTRMAGLVLAYLAGTLALGQEPRRPNIVIIIADDLGYGDIGVHQCHDIPTPHIDSLAQHGLRCTNGYVSGPYCSPTRAGLMTGRYQQRFGHEFNPGPNQPANRDKGLSLEEKTLPERLRDAGYVTGMVGKWHLGYSEQHHPVSRGFQEFYGFLGGGRSYFPGQRADPLLRGKETAEEPDYLTDAFAQEAVAFIERHQSQPFFLYLSFNAVHTPMHAAPKYLSRFEKIEDPKRRTYAAMLSAMDDGIGAVLGKLRQAGLEEHTLVFFLSDNGGPEQANASSNGPLRAGKATTYEGGIRVPFLVHWKGKLPAGKTYDPPVIQLDIVPTALAAAGVKIDPQARLDGVDLLPYLRGDKAAPPHDALYWRFGPQLAIRMGDWKLVKGRDPNVRQPLRRGQADLAGAMLFNLANDPGEQRNLAAEMPQKVKELEAAWQIWNAQLKAPSWGPPDRQPAAQPAP